MKAKTYTVLITVQDSDPPDHGRIQEMIHRALEEGVREYGSVTAAVVDAFGGDCLRVTSANPWKAHNAKAFHKEMREGK